MEPTRCEFTASRFDRDEARHLVSVLREIGVDVRVSPSPSGKTARVTVENVPTSYEARAHRTRNAGRRRGPIAPPEHSPLSPDTPISEVAAWIGSHTVTESMEALGIGSRSTYYRAARRIGLLAEMQAARDEGRLAPHTHTLREA